MNTPHTFIFFGIVGSGKGTQVELLQKYFKEKNITDIVYAYPGSKYRELISGDSYTGSLVKKSIEGGNLQPDFLTTTLFTNILLSSMTQNSIFIADGYPRTIAQSESFEDAMNLYQRTNIHIVYIELSKEEATNRMKLRARADDTDEGIAKRFDEYVNNVIPSMHYFKDKPGYTLHTINGAQSIEAVHADIINALGL